MQPLHKFFTIICVIIIGAIGINFDAIWEMSIMIFLTPFYFKVVLEGGRREIAPIPDNNWGDTPSFIVYAVAILGPIFFVFASVFAIAGILEAITIGKPKGLLGSAILTYTIWKCGGDQYIKRVFL